MHKAAIVFAAVLGLLLVGCGEQRSPPKVAFKATDITGLDYAKDFDLTDHHGQRKTLADFKGKVVLVFFGFTYCPDVCPTTMAEMADVRKKLGADGEGLQVLFISVDPERDTPAVLAQYVPAFDAAFLGLTGDTAAVSKVAKDFKLFVQKVPSRDGKSYTMDHTSGSYVFDRQGRIRLFMRHGQGTEPVLHDLRSLLSAS